MFDTLSDRLESVFKSLRGKGRLSDADIDATAREIRIALLEADVALPVVREFIAAIKERARGTEVAQSLNPAQQVIKIVNEELVGILGGEARPIHLAKTPPTVILLAGLQGTGKTTLAGKLGKWLKEQRHAPLLVASDLQRPNAVQQLQVVGQQAGVDVWAPYEGNGVGDPVEAARSGVEHARRLGHDVTLIEQAEKTFEADEAAHMAEKMLGPGELTLEDFLDQMMMIRRMGPIGNLLGMLPGMGQIKDQISQIDDKDLDRIAAIIRSMTPAERQDPKIINGSRRLRISRGSGVSVQEVNNLVDRFFEARKMMKQMAGSMPGMRRAQKKAGKKGKKGKARAPRPAGLPRGLPA